ncbi:MAG: 4-hydroxythreonine-4-phosphate dehydrogenase PdxA [Thermodesulfobacteriota bacterium]
MKADDQHSLPPVAITMGCPVGVGPEVILRYFHAEPAATADFVVVGDAAVLRRAAAACGMTVRLATWQEGEAPVAGAIRVHQTGELDAARLSWGKPDAGTGRAMASCIEEAVRLIDRGAFAGMATCPISKTALRLAGCPHPGHTEMLAELTGAADFAMMMAADDLKVVLATIHEPLCRVPSLLSREGLAATIRLAATSLARDFGIAEPRLAVAGLNPHAGEGGMFGDEEGRIIAPAVLACRQEGIDVDGPLPPDTVFVKAVAGAYDAVVCQYHDQGLIPFKLLHFHDGVNVTLGLPVVRTSVDHGTAYDIAGTGAADWRSLAAACRLARSMARNRRRFDQGRKV